MKTATEWVQRGRLEGESIEEWIQMIQADAIDSEREGARQRALVDRVNAMSDKERSALVSAAPPPVGYHDHKDRF